MLHLMASRRRLGVVAALVLAIGLTIGVTSGPVASAPPRPQVPVDPTADSNSGIVTTIGGQVTIVAALGAAFDVHGNAVDPLGGIWSCGDLGCITFGVGWSYNSNFTAVSGCTSTSATCTLRYAGGGGTWEEVKAVHGRSGLALKTTAVWVYADPVISQVIVTAVDATGKPKTDINFDFAVYAVRDGFNPTPADCKPWDWYNLTQIGIPNPNADPCVAFISRLAGGLASTHTADSILPVGGTWTLYPFAFIGATEIIRQKPRVWSAVRVTPDGGPINVNSVFGGVDDTGGSTSTTSSSTTVPGSTTTTEAVLAPQPPVVAAATAGPGSSGSVSGTVAGQPGATVTVSIASSSGTTCTKLMSGIGVTTVGSTQIVLNSSGKGAFAVNGPVAAASFVYGTTTAGSTSSVGECFTVPTPPPPTTSTTTTAPPATTTSTTTSTTTTTRPAPTTTTSTTTTAPASTTTTSTTTTTRPAPTTTTSTTTVPTSTTTSTTLPNSGLTFSTVASVPGAFRIEVGSNAGFSVGGYAQIGTGPTAEVRHIAAFGSLIFDAPLAKAHPVGTAVRAMSAPKSDTAPPVIKVQSPEQGDTIRVGERLVLRMRCTDAGVGVESCGDVLKDGAVLDTSSTGVHTATLRAWDRNGNIATAHITWNVTGKHVCDDHDRDDRKELPQIWRSVSFRCHSTDR